MSENILTFVERKSRFVTLVKNNSKKSIIVLDGLFKAIERQKQVKSVTFDCGKEFAQYKLLEVKFGLKPYFCAPGCPWEKGTVEQLNGLIRYYLPFKRKSRSINQKDLDDVAFKLNHIPRKSLDFLTPCEALNNNCLCENKRRCT